MRWAVLAIGCTIGAIFAGVLAVDYWLLQEEEVATLWTRTPGGERYETQVWLVEDGGLDGEAKDVVWLRAHRADARWLSRLRAQPQVELERDGRLVPYRASVPDPDPALLARLNTRLAEKYGLADRAIGFVLPAEQGVAVRLDPDPSRRPHEVHGAHGGL